MSEPAGDRFSTTVPYRVRFDESNPNGVLRASGLLRYAQDCAWIHSERLGFGRDWYAARGLWWVVRCAELLVSGDIRMGETVAVTTTVVGYRKVWARRRTDVRRESGEPVATILTDWVITDSRGLPTRVPEEFVRLFGGRIQTFAPGRVLLLPTPPEASTRTFAVRPQDLDPMGHVNNAAYVDFLDESLLAAGHEAWLQRLPRRYRLEYAAPAALGASITASVWPAGDGVAYRLAGPGGEELVRATLDSETRYEAFRQAVVAGRPWHAPGTAARVG